MNRIQIPDVRLSENFTLYEMLRSEKAEQLDIDNTPNRSALENLRLLVGWLESVRALLGVPMEISSGYRCLLLNRVVGSKDTSDHLLGLAADFTAPQLGTPEDVCRRLVASDIPYKQLIFEHTWVHISFDPITATPKRQVLTLNVHGGYDLGIVSRA